MQSPKDDAAVPVSKAQGDELVEAMRDVAGHLLANSRPMDADESRAARQVMDEMLSDAPAAPPPKQPMWNGNAIEVIRVLQTEFRGRFVTDSACDWTVEELTMRFQSPTAPEERKMPDSTNERLARALACDGLLLATEDEVKAQVAPLASAAGGMPSHPGYRHELSGHETVPREFYDALRAHALTLKSTNERMADSLRISEGARAIAQDTLEMLKKENARLAGEVERLNRQRNERADYVERELSRLRREPESTVRDAMNAILARRCTNPKSVGDSACDCCQHHWQTIHCRALQPASGDEGASHE